MIKLGHQKLLALLCDLAFGNVAGDSGKKSLTVLFKFAERQFERNFRTGFMLSG